MFKIISDVAIFDAFSEQNMATASRGLDVRSRDRLILSCVSQSADFFALEQEWNALFEEAAGEHQVFQSFAWLYHWHAVFAEGVSDDGAARLAIVVGRVNGKLVMVWPLVERRSAGVRTLEWMGSPVSQYGDVILADSRDQCAWFEAGLEYIKTKLKPDAIVLRKVRADSLVARLSVKTKVHRFGSQQAPFLDLTEFQTFADFCAAYSKRTRKTRSRKRRRFLENPGAQEEIYNEGARAGEIVKNILRIKRQWLEERNIVSRAFSRTEFDAFMNRVVAAKERSVNALVTAISFDEQLIAGEIGFRHKDTYFSHVAAYDLEYARLSAGVLQFEDTIEHCIQNKIHRIDLLAPSDPYKLDWATGTVRVDNLAIPCTPKGYVAVLVNSDMPQTLMRKCAKLLPKQLRETLTRAAAKML